MHLKSVATSLKLYPATKPIASHKELISIYAAWPNKHKYKNPLFE